MDNSPLLSNIMLHEFDQYLEDKYLNKKSERSLGLELWYSQTTTHCCEKAGMEACCGLLPLC